MFIDSSPRNKPKLRKEPNITPWKGLTFKKVLCLL